MRSETSYGNGFFTMIKATGLALALSLLLTVVFAALVQAGLFHDGWIYPMNQALKGISIAVGVFIFVYGEKGWLKGGGVGLLFTGLSYLAFSAIGGDFSLSWLILVEILSAFGIGGISGAISVNLRK